MIQWFCLIFSILFDGQASFFGYWFWYWPRTCISGLSDFESFTYFCLQWCVEVWYENICECSKVRNRPVVYSEREAGAYVYFGHISNSKIVLKSPSTKKKICWLKKIQIKKDSGRNYGFTASSHHCGLKQFMQHQFVDFRVEDKLFLLQNKIWKIAKCLILKRQYRPLFMIKWQHKFKHDRSIQNFKFNAMLNAFEKWCVILWFSILWRR